MTDHPRGWSTSDETDGPRLVPVPKPVFNGVAELRLYEEAKRANPKRPDEGNLAYIIRLAEAAQAMSNARTPGEDDE